MDHDIGAGRVLEHGARTPAVIGSGQRQRLGQARPQRAAGLLLGLESIGPHEPVAVEGFSVPEADDVQHAVTVERVVGLQRRMQRILGVAEIETVQVGGDLAVDGDQVIGAPLGGLRPPRPGPVRVVVVLGQRRQELTDDLDVHQTSAVAMTKLTVVAVLPPMFRVPNRRASST